jgi:hypothetical protein
MVDHSGPDLHQPPDDRFYGRLDALAPKCRISDHVQQVVGKTPDQEPCLIGCEATAARLIPPEGILSDLPFRVSKFHPFGGFTYVGYRDLKVAAAILQRAQSGRHDERGGRDAGQGEVRSRTGAGLRAPDITEEMSAKSNLREQV